MANILKRDKQESVLRCLVDGNSMRATTRITGVHRGAVARLLAMLGNGCKQLMDDKMRGLDCARIQVDEIWAYVGKKQRQVVPGDLPEKGDCWTWVALDADTKLVPTYRVGKRKAEDAHIFMCDLASRIDRRIQLSSDALKLYVEATEQAFGGDVDYGTIVKRYATNQKIGKYSPPIVTGIRRMTLAGSPDRAHVSTSYVERANLTMRMSIRRFTRLTNAFSKKVEMMKHAVALHFAYYNFCRVHQTIRCTPAMEASVTGRLWEPGELLDVARIESR